MEQSDIELIHQFGGKGWALHRLKDITSQLNLNMVRFKILEIDHFPESEELKSLRPRETNLERNYNFAELSNTVSEIFDLYDPVYKFFCIDNKILSNYPVLKSSFRANNNPSKQSFAGVSNTKIVKEEKRESFISALVDISTNRGSQWAQYYLEQHQIHDAKIGIIGMELLRKQMVWGTIWGNEKGFYLFISREDLPVIKTKLFKYSFNSPIEIKLNDWTKGIGLCKIIEMAKLLCNSRLGGTCFDIEFCIAADNKITFTQWRPLTERCNFLLDNNLNLTPEQELSSPFSCSFDFNAKVYFPDSSIFKNVQNLASALNVYYNYNWILPYSNKGYDLFRFLQLGQQLDNISFFPSLLVLHGKDQLLGHLHAIAIENEKVKSIMHVYS